MTNFESDGHLLKVFYETKFSEDFINSYISDNFKNIGKKVNRESIKGHGKVDVLIYLEENSEYIIETKNYYNQQDLEFVFKQVLHRIHHRFLYASIVLLVNGFQKNRFKQILENINKWIDLKNGKKTKSKKNSMIIFLWLKYQTLILVMTFYLILLVII
ncbi:hypothetical protein [Candidatus Phytoplasma pini]|uniref:Uncharacterized protein n=1 Tax=Candidatus Phytoplasma pini TaxID=267362 RepID=A0A559KJU9_9MOLU|nr:hypothetical protein [Candidatus Phytoplasma pini]TVY12368.1 hypothetical protein MDPP_00141 [Candidatus Phytoplasma pini]